MALPAQAVAAEGRREVDRVGRGRGRAGRGAERGHVRVLGGALLGLDQHREVRGAQGRLERLVGTRVHLAGKREAQRVIGRRERRARGRCHR